MMKNQLGASLAAASVLVAGGLLAPSMALGQVAAVAKAKAAGTAHSGAMLRTPDGQPDLQGIWSYATLTPLERPSNLAGKEFFTEKEAAEYEKDLLTKGNRDRRDGGIEADVSRAYNELWYDSGSHVVKTRRTSLVIDPPDGRIPALTPAAQQREAARAQDRRNRGGDPADSWEDRNLGERCITRGAPKLSGGYNNNVQIFQAPGYVAIQQEMIHETRIIPLDQRPHLPSSIRLWLGDSRGHWEGNTLVVDTTNYTGKIISNSFNCCRGSGENLHVIERFTRLDADTIDYQFTVDDPSTYTKPWTVSLPMSKTDGPLYEYACHEGNYGMENLLKGARALEKAAAEAK